MTSAATRVAVFARYLFGGGVIAGLCVAMRYRVVCGTYGCVFIAVALLLELKPTRRGVAKTEVKEPPSP